MLVVGSCSSAFSMWHGEFLCVKKLEYKIEFSTRLKEKI
jgi:hypothetical protein